MLFKVVFFFFFFLFFFFFFFLFFFVFFNNFSSGGHFVHKSETILAILVEGYPGNISVQLCLKSTHLPWRICFVLNVFFLLFLALAAVLFSEAEPFLQFL